MIRNQLNKIERKLDTTNTKQKYKQPLIKIPEPIKGLRSKSREEKVLDKVKH
jgi:hypothetical protein